MHAAMHQCCIILSLHDPCNLNSFNCYHLDTIATFRLFLDPWGISVFNYIKGVVCGIQLPLGEPWIRLVVVGVVIALLLFILIVFSITDQILELRRRERHS
jgi:hypothetical protein